MRPPPTTPTILVTGATGFIGRRLSPPWSTQGHDVRAMTRHPESYDGPGEPVAGDVNDRALPGAPLEGVDVAYYLVHSLDDADFERKDAEAARAFAGRQPSRRPTDRLHGRPRRHDGDLSAAPALPS